MNPRPANIIRLRQSTVVTILVFQFIILAILVAGMANLLAVNDFNRRQGYEICVGSNAQIQRVTDKLTEPAKIPDNLPLDQRKALEERNQRAAETRRSIDETVQANNEYCKVLLSSDR